MHIYINRGEQKLLECALNVHRSELLLKKHHTDKLLLSEFNDLQAMNSLLRKLKKSTIYYVPI